MAKSTARPDPQRRLLSADFREKVGQLRKPKTTKEQIEDIIERQISLLLKRNKTCARIFDHVQYDAITQEYNKLELELKALSTRSSVLEVGPAQTETLPILSQ